MYYRHYKGGIYKVILTAMCANTLNEVVVYKDVKNNNTWVRPSNSFYERLESGKLRFKKISIFERMLIWLKRKNK